VKTVVLPFLEGGVLEGGFGQLVPNPVPKLPTLSLKIK
jgi:hypothetical protein